MSFEALFLFEVDNTSSIWPLSTVLFLTSLHEYRTQMRISQAYSDQF